MQRARLVSLSALTYRTDLIERLPAVYKYMNQVMSCDKLPSLGRAARKAAEPHRCSCRRRHGNTGTSALPARPANTKIATCCTNWHDFGA
jgi:hypothetical protein